MPHPVPKAEFSCNVDMPWMPAPGPVLAPETFMAVREINYSLGSSEKMSAVVNQHKVRQAFLVKA